MDKAHQEQRNKVHHLDTYRDSSSGDHQYDHTGLGRTSGQRAADRVPIGQGREVKH